MNFSVYMDWRYDLGAGTDDPSFSPFTMGVQAVIDDQRTGVLPIGASTRILFSGVQITSPLSTLVNFGYDISTLDTRYTGVNVQDTYITPSNQGTWTSLYEEFTGNGASLGRSLQYVNDPRLSDPVNFGSAELFALLSSHLNKQYGYREDVVFEGGGYQHHGIATLTDVTFTDSFVPEPAYGLLLLVGLACIVVEQRRVHTPRP
jgi:hypothetical protein